MCVSHVEVLLVQASQLTPALRTPPYSCGHSTCSASRFHRPDQGGSHDRGALSKTHLPNQGGRHGQGFALHTFFAQEPLGGVCLSFSVAGWADAVQECNVLKSTGDSAIWNQLTEIDDYVGGLYTGVNRCV